MTSKNYILISGLSLALWILAAQIMFWFFPVAMIGSVFLGWMLGRSDQQNPRHSIAYAYSIGPAALATIFCLCWWINNPDNTFGLFPALMTIVYFICLLTGFSVGRHIKWL
jgi:hypothetical protein